MSSFKKYTIHMCIIVVVTIMIFGVIHLDNANRRERSGCKLEQPLTDSNFNTEFETVKSNLDRCLRAAELMEYFHHMSLYDTAVENAACLLSFIRSVVPQNFSREFNMPCWQAHFEVKLHSKKVVGSINEKAFNSPKDIWHLPALRTLQSMYNGNKTSNLVCLPSLFLAGFPKCGSTYVYCLLRTIAYQAHVSNWRAEVEKEPRMWVGTSPSLHHQYPHNLNDLTRYLFNFMPSVDTLLSSQYSLAVDASPSLLFQWPRYTPWESMENYCLLPAVLPQILPSSRYIVVLREPASMLYSAFWFSCTTLNMTLTRQQQVDAPNVFHMEVVKAIKTFHQCTEHNPTDKCIDAAFQPRTRTDTRSCLRLRFEMAFYYHYIRRWLAVIPRRQFLFLTTEELNKTTLREEIMKFVGISEFDESDRLKYGKIKCKSNKSKFHYQSDPALLMKDDTMKLLNEFFAPFNQKLANLLGDNKFLWKKM